MKLRSTIKKLGLLLIGGLSLSAARADENDWRPLKAPRTVERARELSRSQPAVSLGRPVPVSLGAPIPVAEETTRSNVTPASYAEPQPIVRAQAPDAVVPPVGNGGVIPPPPPAGGGLYDSGAVTPANNGGWWGKSWGHMKDSFNRTTGQRWQSDLTDDFVKFASPVSSPFLSEDPRSLTELKPLFIYQSIPGSNPAFQGGNVWFYGLQGRLAISECWSIVLNKFGGVSLQPDNKDFVGDESGFAEVWIGPKWTFFRDPTNKTAAAVGLTFQIPWGSSKVFQNTGDLTLSPYISFAKGFGPLPQGYGNFNLMGTAGFAFSVDNQRSDYFYGNLHLDFDVGGQNRLFPLIELNYTRYINNGGAMWLPFEGGDLFNFGSSAVSNKNNLNLAVGARYKLGGRDCVQFGGAVEFPLSGQKDMNDFRITLDVIFRY